MISAYDSYAAFCARLEIKPAAQWFWLLLDGSSKMSLPQGAIPSGRKMKHFKTPTQIRCRGKAKHRRGWRGKLRDGERQYFPLTESEIVSSRAIHTGQAMNLPLENVPANQPDFIAEIMDRYFPQNACNA